MQQSQELKHTLESKHKYHALTPEYPSLCLFENSSHNPHETVITLEGPPSLVKSEHRIGLSVDVEFSNKGTSLKLLAAPFIRHGRIILTDNDFEG